MFAGCFTTALWTIARSAQFDFTDVQVEARGTVRNAESSYGFNEIVIRPKPPDRPFQERKLALDLLNRAENRCLVSPNP